MIRKILCFFNFHAWTVDKVYVMGGLAHTKRGDNCIYCGERLNHERHNSI